ncbi:YheC/YheD family protein [Bacillus pinisoli]|uniref:YheC/YheD family endospore coat-associated protein n=1 Tax=Bacillus pinisoli TaxID=2901866 RepID=UPI001FF5C14B|nr:YheC/YheD family protein [Bacillus pinisoli]
MTTLGFLTIKKQQELSYFTEIAKCIKNSKVGLYRFTPLDIDPGSEMVHGYTYNKVEDQWESAIFPIPDYIYDRCFYQGNERSKRAEPIVRWLKQRPGTTFLGYGLPNKWEIYQTLRESDVLSSYLPSTRLIENIKQLKGFLRKEKSIIIKPISGSQGNGVMHLELSSQSIQVHSQQNGESIFQSIQSSLEFKQFAEQLLQETAYIGQSFLPLTHHARPYDIRILLQKNVHGQWIEQGRGVRLGKEAGLVSNLHHGGEVIPVSDIMSNWPPPLKELIQEEMNTIVEELPLFLEERFGRLFELGLDIGVTKEGAVYVLDINSKPGRKVIMTLNNTIHDELYRAPLSYIQYLDRAKSESK